MVNVAIDKYVRGTWPTTERSRYARRVHRRPRLLGVRARAGGGPPRPDADLDEIAEAAFAAETAEGVAGGRQDQYAACYGGLSYMTFSRPTGAAGLSRSNSSTMPESHLAALQKRLVLVDSGVARLSGEIHAAVWAAYARHDDGSPARCWR